MVFLNQDIEGERIRCKRTSGCTEFTFFSKKVVKDAGIGWSGTMIAGQLGGKIDACVTYWSAKLEEVAERFLWIVTKVSTPFRDV